MTPSSTPDLASTVTRLETENRHLIARVEKLEILQKTTYSALAANAILLICAGLLLIYLGWIPLNTTRLPLRAGTVDAEEYLLSDRDGKVRARVLVDEKGFRLVDRAGNTVFPRPGGEAPAGP